MDLNKLIENSRKRELSTVAASKLKLRVGICENKPKNTRINHQFYIFIPVNIMKMLKLKVGDSVKLDYLPSSRAIIIIPKSNKDDGVILQPATGAFAKQKGKTVSSRIRFRLDESFPFPMIKVESVLCDIKLDMKAKKISFRLPEGFLKSDYLPDLK